MTHTHKQHKKQHFYVVIILNSGTLKEKIKSFDLKNESLVELNLDPGLRVIRQYLSQIDSIEY